MLDIKSVQREHTLFIETIRRADRKIHEYVTRRDLRVFEDNFNRLWTDFWLFANRKTKRDQVWNEILASKYKKYLEAKDEMESWLIQLILEQD